MLYPPTTPLFPPPLSHCFSLTNASSSPLHLNIKFQAWAILIGWLALPTSALLYMLYGVSSDHLFLLLKNPSCWVLVGLRQRRKTGKGRGDLGGAVVLFTLWEQDTAFPVLWDSPSCGNTETEINLLQSMQRQRQQSPSPSALKMELPESPGGPQGSQERRGLSTPPFLESTNESSHFESLNTFLNCWLIPRSFRTNY